MRLLHTSDWHLGSRLGGVSREPDHAAFLDWLLAFADAEAVDVIVVAGDVFDVSQPSAEAQTLYFDFLARASQTRVRQVVVIGGNHDSPSRLDAPREVLGALRVHVVGGLDTDPASWARCVCPVHDASGTLIGAIAAVPYVHEYRLGVRGATEDVDDVRKTLHEAFEGLYTAVADAAVAQCPGVPLVATGHMTCVGAEAGDFGAHIHQIAAVGALSPRIFDPRFQAVCLGHVHRMFRVLQETSESIERRMDHVGRSAKSLKDVQSDGALGEAPNAAPPCTLDPPVSHQTLRGDSATAAGPQVWYCGTPIPLRLGEAREPRHVLLMEATVDGVTVTPTPVPRFRDLVALEGEVEEVEAALVALTSDAPLPPLVYAKVNVDAFVPGLLARLEAAVGGRDDDARRPQVVAVRQVGAARSSAAEGSDEDADVRLADLGAEEVFIKLCAARGETADADLLGAFRSLLSARADTPPPPAVERPARAIPQQDLFESP